MKRTDFFSRIYQLTEWITKLAYLNILWIVFTAMGLVILGIGPATTALFSVVRNWVIGKKDVPIFKTFVKNYKGEFIRSNQIEMIFILIGIVLYADFRFLAKLDGLMQKGAVVLFLFLCCIYILTYLHIFPILSHYRLKRIQDYIKNAFLIGISQVKWTALIIIGIAMCLYLFKLIPGMIPFFGVSIICYIIMWSSYQSIKRIELKKE